DDGTGHRRQAFASLKQVGERVAMSKPGVSRPCGRGGPGPRRSSPCQTLLQEATGRLTGRGHRGGTEIRWQLFCPPGNKAYRQNKAYRKNLGGHPADSYPPALVWRLRFPLTYRSRPPREEDKHGGDPDIQPDDLSRH